MFKIFWFFISIVGIILILLKVPNNTGLESIATKNNFLGSPSSTEKFITYATWFCILCYMGFAIQFNLVN
jgi:protein translocase SecG subunit|tara:strand:- start:702 stop:911 length:210 start_codon:yes stop_codon:yes gene_type:complete